MQSRKSAIDFFARSRIFPELGAPLLRPGTHHYDLNVPADGRQIVDQLEAISVVR
jgi:hypothetical protein